MKRPFVVICGYVWWLFEELQQSCNRAAGFSPAAGSSLSLSLSFSVYIYIHIYMGWWLFEGHLACSTRAHSLQEKSISVFLWKKLNSSISPKFTSRILLNREVSRERLRVFFFWPQYLERSCSDVARSLFFLIFFLSHLKIWSGVAKMLLVFYFIRNHCHIRLGGIGGPWR